MIQEIFREIEPVVNIFKDYWWIFLPFFLWKPASFFWLTWRTEKFLDEQDMILLEIKIPKENLKPIRAMEQVMSGLWQAFWDPPNFWEKWWDGKICLGWQMETVSIGGEIHFYIRCATERRDTVELGIYSQYPEAEITLADDYTKKIPQDIPNKDWDMWGTDYKLNLPNPYPIKTYPEFEKETEKFEEKRVDPMAALLEGMAKIKPGQQLWLQFQVTPLGQEFADPFTNEGKAIRDKLAKRPEKPKMKPMIQEAAEIVITGKPPQTAEQEEQFFIPPEMKLTPGERDIIAGVENKISKPPFECSIRFIYLGKKDAWVKANLRMLFVYFGNYVTQHMNSLVPLGATMTKVYSRPPLSIFDKRRVYLRKRKLFRYYQRRFWPMYPRKGNYSNGSFILNTEEVASLYHFPSKAVAPAIGVQRVEVKKGGIPPQLPVE